jgi:hypothetical protein
MLNQFENMLKKWQSYASKRKYTAIFINLILVFLLTPLSEFYPILSYLLQLIFLSTIIFAINILSFPKRVLFGFRIIAAIAFLADVIVIPDSPELTKLTSIISLCFHCLFIILSLRAIAMRIIKEKRVDKDVIMGSVCLYLLIGILWFFLYKIIFLFDEYAFRIPDFDSVNKLLFYFSFTTLTTLGYGDITPDNAFAMMLANGEALLGQLFPAIFIAKLVSLYSES